MALVLLLLLLAPPGRAAGEVDDGFHATPSLGWQRGEQRIDLSLSHRYRYESWKARSSTRDGIHGFRTRLGVRYAWKDTLGLFVEGQHLRIDSLSPNTSGVAAGYRANTPGGDKSSTDHVKVRQLYLDLTGMESRVRAGRQDIEMGTEVTYPEADWTFVKVSRLSQRLVGTVGWTDVERSNDGLSVVSNALEGHTLHAFVAQPTTGVVDVPSAYERQEDITFGGVEWTVRRGTALEDTELSFFGLAYHDGRPPRDGGRTGDVKVYTLGASVLGIYPLGPGKVDVALWGAFQWGDFSTTTEDDPSAETLHHLAGAGIVELGYHLPEVFAEPWIRVGVNAASGDGDAGDGDHNTFFNMLPTNHPYYGYADQIAFQNLVDAFVQLELRPHRRVRFEVMWHYFALATGDDDRYSGSGAFNKDSFGFARQPTGGQSDLGHEIDLTGVVTVHEHVELRAGYSHLFGGDAFAGPETRDTEWAYIQLLLTY